MQINTPSQGEDDWSTLLGRRLRPLSYRVVKWPFCHSSLLGHGNRLKYSNPQPHQAKQRPKCTNPPPLPGNAKGKNALSPTLLRRAEIQSSHKTPPMPIAFPGWGLEAFQWQMHYIYLVSKCEKELFFSWKYYQSDVQNFAYQLWNPQRRYKVYRWVKV